MVLQWLPLQLIYDTTTGVGEFQVVVWMCGKFQASDMNIRSQATILYARMKTGRGSCNSSFLGNGDSMSECSVLLADLGHLDTQQVSPVSEPIWRYRAYLCVIVLGVQSACIRLFCLTLVYGSQSECRECLCVSFEKCI